MGAKDSKPSFISYEDAVKRVSDNEFRRIKEAFKRCAGANGTALSLEAFVREVLCDGVPYEVAEWLYQACGGTKRGINFKDLLCGIVVLTKGNLDEKIKFLWTLYVNNQSDNGMYIYKRDFARALHLENTSLPVTRVQRSSEILTSLFGLGEKVTYEQFRSWLLMHKDATVLSKWLLSDQSHVAADLDTPTFYQSLAGVTHLEERDIVELEKCFWSLRNAAPTGQLDCESLAPLLCPPLPRAALAGVCAAFDENRDGHVDFKELCCGLSAACRGPKTERLKFCFKIFDVDRDNVLNEEELVAMVDILCTIANEELRIEQDSRPSTPSDGDSEPEKGFEPERVLKELRTKLVPSPAGESGVLPLEEFLMWSVGAAAALVSPCLRLLLQLCHVVLALRPRSRRHEADIVYGWLRRSVWRGLAVGQFWYLVSASWWAQWAAYVAAAPERRDSAGSQDAESLGSLLSRADSASQSSQGSAGRPPPIDNSPLLAPPQTQVRTLTGEGGMLRRDVTLAQHRDFELVPAPLWHALAHWYRAPEPLPRQVIRPPNSDVELELYPLQLKIYRHAPNPQRMSTASALGGTSMYSSVPLAPAPPPRQLAYTAAFSRLATVKQVSEFLSSSLGMPREDMRLWLLPGGADGAAVLLDDDSPALQSLGLQPGAGLLLERRAPDRAWPEEIGALGGARGAERRLTLAAAELPGATGLHNLGNTCYMNAALQAVWNTAPLTRYFTRDMHLYELNVDNPLGTRGALALRFADLCKEVWSSGARSVAPLRVRWVVSRHARALAGGGQHDAQELLAWLLDALHEDLNRAAPPCAAPPPRPRQVVPAQEAWEQYLARNNSIITELFYGQLKSRVRCLVCQKDSIRFETFNMLSLPLPMDDARTATVRVILLDGSVPVRYAVRVSSTGTHRDLKRALSALCGLSVYGMLLVELAGSTIGRVLEDSGPLSTAAELYVYELPPAAVNADINDAHITPDWSTDGGDSGVSGVSGSDASGSAGEPEPDRPDRHDRPAGPAAERSRSEILMSQSPPNTFYKSSIDSDGIDVRSRTLPRDLKSHNSLGNSSPTLSVRSLTLRPSTPQLGRVKFGSSPSHMYRMNETKEPPKIQYLIAVHRKQTRRDAYFLASQRCKPTLFGVPLLVPLCAGGGGRQLYAAVWTQVSRLLSARPPADTPAQNHATDCDDSLGYEFPFTLRAVTSGGEWCAACAWPALCRGCVVPLVCPRAPPPGDRRASCDESPLAPASPIAHAKLQRQASARNTAGHDLDTDGPAAVQPLDLEQLCETYRRNPQQLMLAIDWEPTALHLRYQSSREKACIEHPSVAECGAAAGRGVDLASCLRAFTSEERLDARYHCAQCARAQPACKTLQLWRLPPVLIIHLKRFQYVNNKWIKSQKVVNFPLTDFDPTAYLAAVPQETSLRHQELRGMREGGEEGEGEGGDGEHAKTKGGARKRLQSASLTETPVRDDELVDFHQHRLQPACDPLDLKYRLYSVVSHSGQLSGGHYVAYARNPSGAWLCYNDSMCRAAPAGADPAAAYLLFYERSGLAPARYMPDITGKEPVVKDPDALDPDENDLKKMCVIT